MVGHRVFSGLGFMEAGRQAGKAGRQAGRQRGRQAGREADNEQSLMWYPNISGMLVQL